MPRSDFRPLTLGGAGDAARLLPLRSVATFVLAASRDDVSVWSQGISSTATAAIRSMVETSIDTLDVDDMIELLDTAEQSL